MECRTAPRTNRLSNRGQGAFAYVELMVGGAVGSIVAGALLAFSAYTGRGLFDLNNRLELSAQSRHALDRITQDIRQASNVSSYTTNNVTLTYEDGSSLVLERNPFTREVTRTHGGQSRVLLTECDQLLFTMYTRAVNSASFDLNTTTNVDSCKALNVSWTCSRPSFGEDSREESTTSATINMRMK